MWQLHFAQCSLQPGNNMVPEIARIETCVTSEEGNISLPAKKYDDLVILHPFATSVNPDLPCCYPSGFQQESLAFKNISFRTIKP
jgi:hypothetical protein